MQDRPTALELLEAVRSFIEDDVVPVLDGRRRFRALVAANVLAIVRREWEGEEAALLDEWEGLVTLLGDEPGQPPARLGALREAVRTLDEELARRIRAGEADTGPWRDAVRAHVRDAVLEKLRVANPRFVGGESR
jgi:hypothetical protein